MKDSLMIQGVHYKLLSKKAFDIDDIPFYYFVFSSQDPNNIKIVKQEVDESKMQSHIVAIDNIKQRLSQNIASSNFEAHPSMQKCANCPISHKCSMKAEVPLIQEVYY